MTDFPPELIRAVQNARHIAVLTGAGVSSESGVPTFRDAQTGLWAKYDPHELATPEAFRRNPQLVWEWYEWRRGLVARAQPNPGHLALAAMERYLAGSGSFTLITQNVDNLHQQAGSQTVIELHGNLHRAKCFRENRLIDPDAWLAATEVPPHCPQCGDYLRPDVVWFGEALPPAAWHLARRAAEACDVFFTIGTSALVQPAASLPYRALERGAVTVEINPDETPLTDEVKYSLRGKAGVLLPELVKAVWADTPRT